MSVPPKAPPIYKPVLQGVSAPPVYRPQHAVNPGVQFKPISNFKLETRPAPPVYRPQQGHSTALPKPQHAPLASAVTQLRQRPNQPLPARPSFVSIPAVQATRPANLLQPVNREIRISPNLNLPHATPPIRNVVVQPRNYSAASATGHRPSLPPAMNLNATIQRAFLVRGWNAVVNYFSPPPQVVVDDQEDEVVDPYEQMLTENRTHFLETGRPKYRELTNKYPNSLDKQKWLRLTSIHGRVSNIKKRTRNASAIHGLVKELLDNFVSYGFGYRLMEGTSTGLLDTEYSKDSANGNCFAYAKAFADIVNSFGIDAEVREVRGDEQGRFIVKLSRFIDSTVQGHIYEKGVLKTGYYVFTSHFATWVPATQQYYDPMSTVSYHSLDPYIECELDSDKNEVVYTPSEQPKTLCTNYKWKLIRRDIQVTGGFRRLDLVPLKKKK